MNGKRIILAGVLCFSSCIAVAQKYNIKTYSVNDGLPSSQVYDVHLDEGGLVWFATAYGLVQFDGFDFKTIDRTNGLRDELIYDIFEDSRGRFWVSTETGGVGRLVEDTVIYPQELSVLDTMIVNYITESPDNELWFSTNYYGNLIWDGNSFKKVSTEDGLPSNMIWDVWFDADGRAWISTMKGVALYDREQGVIKTWTSEDGLSGEATYQVFGALDGSKWIPTSNGISIIKGDRIETLTRINGNELGYVYNINQDNDGVIWIGTERRGLYWYDGETYTHITKKNGLSSNYIYRLIKDRDGTIWVATDGNGVNIFKDNEFRFYDNESSFGANSVYGVHLDREGNLWYTTENGLIRYKEGKFSHYEIPGEFNVENEIWSIDQLPNGNLILITYDYQLLEFDGKTFERSVLNEELSKYYLADILVENDGTLWFAEETGLVKYSNGEITKFTPSDEYWKNFVTMLFQDSKGNIWLGTEGGAAKYDGHSFTYYSEKDGLNGQSIYEIREDSRGNIWIGTNKGLSVIQHPAEEGQVVQIKTFENDDIYLPETILLIFDNQGGLWQGTNGGLNYYDVNNWYSTGNMEKAHFALKDYGKGIEFNGQAAIKDEYGHLWLGTARKGVINYDPEKVKQSLNITPPRTFIRRFSANEEIVFEQTVSQEIPDNITLNHAQQNIEIEFRAVNYDDPYHLFYRYKLEGFDENWERGFDEREVVYNNLKPGKYRFIVTAKSSKSGWTQNAATVEFEIKKPVWMTWWFLLGAALVFIGVIVLYINIHLSIAEKRKLKTLVDEQTEDLRKALDEKEVLIKEIHHRVKNNLAVVSGLLELQGYKLEDGEAKWALEDSKLRIKTMSIIHEKLYQNESLANVDFKEFANDLVLNVANSMKATDKNVNTELDIQVGNLDINIAIPCGLMLNELLSNCYEHAFPDNRKGTIDIRFVDLGSQYKLTVFDNGIGIDPDILQKERSSLGITLISSLTQQVEGNINIENKDGTRITVLFPKEQS